MRQPDRTPNVQDRVFYTRYAAVQARLRAELLRNQANGILAQLYANLALAKALVKKASNAGRGR